MGCDIHLHVEGKFDGVWYSLNSPRISRNYDLFEKMANVRSNGGETPISDPRGLPEDISVVAKADNDLWGDDTHSHSWLNLDEIKKIIHWGDNEKKYTSEGWMSWSDKQFGYLFGNDFKDFQDADAEENMYPEGLQDVRFVFWFDC